MKNDRLKKSMTHLVWTSEAGEAIFSEGTWIVVVVLSRRCRRGGESCLVASRDRERVISRAFTFKLRKVK